MSNPAIQQWRNRVPSWKCPGTGCENQLPEGRVVCSRVGCREEYLKVFQRGRRGTLTLLRRFVVAAVPGQPFRARLVFTPCGHSLEVPRSKVRRRPSHRRRRCEACARGEKPTLPAGDEAQPLPQE